LVLVAILPGNWLFLPVHALARAAAAEAVAATQQVRKHSHDNRTLQQTQNSPHGNTLKTTQACQRPLVRGVMAPNSSTAGPSRLVTAAIVLTG
jgi:hypothetical protein